MSRDLNKYQHSAKKTFSADKSYPTDRQRYGQNTRPKYRRTSRQKEERQKDNQEKTKTPRRMDRKPD